MKKHQKQFNNRLKAVFGGIIVIGFVLITNLFYIQVRTGEQLRAQADGQYIVATHNSFERGNIYFEGKEESRTTAAGQKKGYKISVNPTLLDDEDLSLIYSEINKLHPLDEKVYLSKVSDKNRNYVEIATHILKDNGELIKIELGKKIQLHSQKWRIYPLKNSAAHVLGFLGYDKNDVYGGRYGLENYYESTLRREDKDLYTNFFARVFDSVQNLADSEKKPEGDLIATIDPQIQLFFERELSGIQSKWNSQSTAGIIMNPKTGEIYAMSALPNFDNNDFKYESLSTFTNPLASNVYEFGSVMKPLVVAIGLDQGVINAETDYYDKGSVDVEEYTIYNFDKKGRGWVTVQEVLNQSLNTGMVFVSDKIQKDSFRKYFKKYGFGEKSGVDLPNDSIGLTSNLKSNRDIEFANMSFGQGIALSPLSFIKSTSALANGGMTVVPHVVREIEYTNGFGKTFDYEEAGERAITKNTADEITRMLVNVFDNYGNGKTKLPHHRIAAKTGTAQIAHPEGGYYDDRNLHSFFGYFPAYDPEFLIFMYTVHPKGVKYASQTLVQPFKETSEYLINYYNIPPDR